MRIKLDCITAAMLTLFRARGGKFAGWTVFLIFFPNFNEKNTPKHLDFSFLVFLCGFTVKKPAKSI